jgi:hypothetical protein
MLTPSLPWRCGPARSRASGFTLIDLLIGSAVLAVAALVGVMHVTTSVRELEQNRESAYARQRAISLVEELKAYAEGSEAEFASDLDTFDDGSSYSPTLTIIADPTRPTGLVAPDHPVSDNVPERGGWAWYRRIRVRPLGPQASRDLRLVTARVYRWRPGRAMPGEQLAEVSTVIRTLTQSYPTTQVYDLYVLAIENVPGWWVSTDVMQPFFESSLQDLQARNAGLVFRTHWITKIGVGRDEEYAPYTNESRVSTDTTAWTYVYPGRLPQGEAAIRYYVPNRLGARVNVDGASTPLFRNDRSETEPYVDANGNGRYDAGEAFTDLDGDGAWSLGNPVPYAFADMHNHCKRWPEEKAWFEARVAAGQDDPSTPTFRLLLDQMISEPESFRNAILVNLHGELLPMPPARNVSDPAKDPELRPGWRVVTHPELLCPARVAGDDSATQAPRFRVYAYKAQLLDTEVVTTQAEPFEDLDGNGVRDAGETFVDWNGNGRWDAGLPITIVIPGGDFSQAPNAAAAPSIVIRRLRGGVDADGNGTADAYQDWDVPPRYPEPFADANGDGIRQVAEPWFDVDGDGVKTAADPHQEIDGDGKWSPGTEGLTDTNGNGVWDLARPAEPYTDTNGNGKWDAAEPYWDYDGNGAWTPPTLPKTPWVEWNPSDYGNPAKTLAYIVAYGEPFRDLNGNKKWDGAEPFLDTNGNGVRDGGHARGEMWFEIEYQAAENRTVLTLHGTPLETPLVSNRGLPPAYRLYDLDYVPCPTPSGTTAGGDRYARSLYTSSTSYPKNTARWTIALPPAAIRRGFETSPGANDGDQRDRIVAVETRLGRDLSTGTMWPTRHKPANRSVTYAYFYADANRVPYSERYQFLGDPRHSPYADTDRHGAAFPNGYNWYFDNLVAAASATDLWRAFDGARLADAWMGARGGAHDVPRLLAWLRNALARSEVVYTTLTGFSYYYLSVGGDVGADVWNGFPNSIPMSGLPFGLAGAVNENTLTDNDGTASIRGSLKYVRSNSGNANGIRSGGAWWSKPWLGELYEDTTYASQWAPWGNLRAATGSGAGTYRLIRRADVPAGQQPTGTALVNAYGRLSNEGCTSLFNVGTSSSTFHHQMQTGRSGSLVEDGAQLASNYSFAVPTTAPISRPFGIATNGTGGVGPEFTYTDTYPRFSAALERRFYDHEVAQTGSGIVRLTEPGASPRAARIVVNGLDRTASSGSSFIARYSVLSLLHGYFVAGRPGAANRVPQLPRVELTYPTLTTELDNPSAIPVRWRTQWKRWDGRNYTDAYSDTFVEPSADLRYVLLYSRDAGRTWRYMADDQIAEPGVLPLVGGAPDPARTVADTGAADQTWLWSTPAGDFPEGGYLLRIEAYRATRHLHYSHHMERVYVDR